MHTSTFEIPRSPQVGSRPPKKIKSKWVPKSMISVIFVDRFVADSMFNFASRPGRLLFSFLAKGNNNKKERKGKTREDKTRQAQGKTRQKEQKKTS